MKTNGGSASAVTGSTAKRHAAVLTDQIDFCAFSVAETLLTTKSCRDL